MNKMKGLRRSPRSGGSVCLCVFSLPVLPPLAALVGAKSSASVPAAEAFASASASVSVLAESCNEFVDLLVEWIFLYPKLDYIKLDFSKIGLRP